MNIYNIKWTRLQAEIFRILSIKRGRSLNLRGIARPLGKSPTAVANALKGLEKESLIKIKREKNIRLLSIELNENNQKAIDLKRVENLKLVYESGLADFLKDSFPGNTVILFGSYSRGNDVWAEESEGHTSDIDIAIVGTKGKETDLTTFNKKLERTIIINFYASFNEIHKHLKDNILNGILLSGSVDL